ncbi:PH domain containing protein [Acanthamoeba castellanii str. Neff]|uniref:PH domain containing protein n=1 Tax=Acanthamoeba castellanii (strain ATCC 30010 / Neff) TaxID=1257118 RepID=L8GZ46_ACACF|nr:PH domain containing protein [Acanthamoeba castellanii str. Neff]ELR18217.1 PH domain containing protein [Acanthamoeba castellanii str. Neff]
MSSVFLMMEAAGRKQGEVYLAVALQDHYSRQKGFLEFKKGQVLAVVDEKQDEGLLKGQTSLTQFGWFPNFFVRRAEDEDLFVGWIKKRGAIRKSWKVRWFQLNPSKKTLSYHEAPGTSALHVIDLHLATEATQIGVEDIPSGEKEYKSKPLFKLVTPERVWYMCADSEEQRLEWLEALQAVIQGMYSSSSVLRPARQTRPDMMG